LRVVGMTCTNFIQCTAHSSTSNWIQVAVASDVQPHINLICSSNTNDTFIQSVCYCLAVPTQWYVVFTVSSLLIFCQKFSQVVWCFVSTLKSALHEPTDGPSCRPTRRAVRSATALHKLTWWLSACLCHPSSVTCQWLGEVTGRRRPESRRAARQCHLSAECKDDRDVSDGYCWQGRQR